jgi:hypothetical protein
MSYSLQADVTFFVNVTMVAKILAGEMTLK